MKLMRWAAFSVLATGLTLGSCSKASEADSKSTKAASASAGDEGPETAKTAENTPALGDAVKRPPVPKAGPGEAQKTAQREAPETEPGSARDPAAGLEPPTVAIGATKTKVIQMGTQTAAETDSYKVNLKVPSAPVKAGSEGVVNVSVTPKEGWKLNEEFPTKLSVEAPAGISLSKAVLGAADATSFTKKGATWAVRFVAESAGKHDFKAKFKFAVCTDATCDPKKEQLAWAIEAK